ncbi:hypothetical protein BC827DRAFT_1282164 [Russula dissimulans]|nr:hypothetical protein BC827DRAFT_1282164 [Russula dissimulans]
MAAACVHCYGCKRDFTPCGLSQHLTRTKGSMYHSVHVALQTPTLFTNAEHPLTFEVNPPRYWEDDVSGDLGQRFPSISGAVSGDNVVEALGLSYRTADELNAIIDKTLPGYPSFKSLAIKIGGEELQFHYRDILPLIQALYGNPEFACDLIFAPERHYLDSEKTHQVYSEMHTGDWWWSVQQPGATIIPLVVSSDKTQLTLFRNKMAYPVYLTIGNVPKDIRRKPSRWAQILIAYIPTSKLDQIDSKAAHRRALSNLFHACMQQVLGPIALHGKVGIPMVSRDGVWRRCHPIFTTFVGDYPEQALVTCTYYRCCPKCLVRPDQLGEHCCFLWWDYNKAIETYLQEDGDVRAFHATCHEAGLKPMFHPFWESFPLVDIFVSITPDILHQLLQGVVKHLVSWITSPNAFGRGVDLCCRTIPPNHHVTLFPKGISILSRVSGKEYKSMCRILLGPVVDLPLPHGQLPTWVLRAVRALLDFVYLAQFQCHTHFNIPKFHSLIHYSLSIILFGTTDNYNTEQMERLHIEFTKDAYRATNRKDEIPQMTSWLSRCEKVQKHATFIKWLRDHGQHATPHPKPIGPPQPSTRISFDDLSKMYGAVDFQDALADFIASVNYPNASAAALHTHAADTSIPFHSVPVFHKVKFTAMNTSEIIDSVVIRPEQTDTYGRLIPARFDTVLVHGQQRNSIHEKKGHRIAQVCVVFQIPKKVISTVFLSSTVSLPEHLAYVNWFSYVSRTRDSNHGMYGVSRLMQNSQRQASIIPVDSIFSSVHLIPRFGQNSLQESNSFTVLENCHNFYVNPFSDVDSYLRFS